jgi:hypothetical protein
MLITLSQGKFAIVDESDFEYLNQWKWYYNSTGYAVTRMRLNEGSRKSKIVKMHRVILSITDSSIQVDHINHNRLDNRRANLRLCTTFGNNQNRQHTGNNRSGYKGVTKPTNNPKFVARISTMISGEQVFINLGSYTSKHDAAREYNKAAIEMYGEFAVLNEIKEAG